MKQYNYRYKIRGEENWHKSFDGFVSCELQSKMDEIIVRLECDHKNTWVENGIKRCKDCGDELEITSYRD
jgi:hypothetical protein